MSEAEAVTLVVPETVAPAAGAVIDVVGGVVSGVAPWLIQIGAEKIHRVGNLQRRSGSGAFSQQGGGEARDAELAGGVVADGSLIGLCIARYGRTWPPAGGSASLSVTVEAPPELVERLERLLAELGWQGIFELELLQLGARFAPVDFNPRPFGWMTLALRAGANQPAVWAVSVRCGT